MHVNRNHALNILIASLMVSAFASTLHATTIVNWGDSSTGIVSNWQNMTVNKGSTAVSFAGYSNPAVGANYYNGYDSLQVTPRFYGAIAASYVNSASTLVNLTSASSGFSWQVAPGTPNILSGSLSNLSGYSASLHHIYLWSKSDFLAGSAADSTVTLNGIHVSANDNSSTTVSHTFMVIRLGSSWYISSDYGDYSSSYVTRGFDSPALVSAWYNYDPTADFTAIGSAVTLTDFSNLTAAGVYINTTFSSANPGAIAIVSRIADVTIDATITDTSIPEPAAFGLAFCGVALLTLRRRT